MEKYTIVKNMNIIVKKKKTIDISSKVLENIKNHIKEQPHNNSIIFNNFCKDLQLLDIKKSDTYTHIGIIPVFLSHQNISEYQKDIAYLQITDFYVKNENNHTYYYCIDKNTFEKSNIYDYLYSLCHINRDTIKEIIEFIHNTTIKLYICIVNTSIQRPFIQKKTFINRYSLYNTDNSTKQNIYKDIIDQKNFKHYMDDVVIYPDILTDTTYKIPIIDIYRKLSELNT